MNSQNPRDDVSFPVGPSQSQTATDIREDPCPYPVLQRYRANPIPPSWRMNVLVRPSYTYRRATADPSTSIPEPSASASIQSSVSAEE